MAAAVAVGLAVVATGALVGPRAGAQAPAGGSLSRQPPSGGVNPPAVPPAPVDVVGAKAYATLERYCARCHQYGRMADQRPARGLANILALSEIARDRWLVQPGIPDASRLFTVMLPRDAAHEAVHEQGVEDPSPEDVLTVREWIAGLPQSESGRAACEGRKPVAPEATGQAVAGWLAAADAEAARQSRFVSLVHLYNACASEAELAGFRQAVSKLFNLLSWSAEPVRLEPIDPAGLVIRVPLADLGWIAAHWERLAAAYPYAELPGARLPAAVLEQTGTRLPLIAVDWLADVALRPPLYAELLGLPGRLANLQRILKLDIEQDVRRGTARRAGILASGEVRYNRVVERHATPHGGFWLAYDFAGLTGRSNIVENPLGPAASDAARHAFRADAMRILFHLPNGFPAFVTADARGERSEKGLPEIDRDRSLPAGTADGARQCLRCHAAGPLDVRDEIRPLFTADRPLARDLRESVLALYAPGEEIDRLVGGDAARTRSALARAGIDPALQILGLEPVDALAWAHQRPVGIERAAAELGTDPAALRQRLVRVTGETAFVARKLRHDAVRRSDLQRLYRDLVAELGQPAPADALEPAPARTRSSRGPELALRSDADSYAVGETVTFFAQASEDCYLTLINVDRSGRATVLFPNEAEQGSLLAAGRELRVPGPDSPYRFRFKERGQELLVGICARTPRAPEGVRHDFERQRFTVLGDWGVFTKDQLAAEEAGGRREEAGPPDRQRGTRRPARPKDARDDRATRPPVAPEARAAIIIDVR